MGVYHVTHKCGHEERVELFGSSSERQRRIDRMEAEECPACRARSAGRSAAAKGFAKLKGSDKQVSWASDIREDMLAKVANEEARKVALVDVDWSLGTVPDALPLITRNEALELDDEILALYEGLRGESSARWLIDNRDCGRRRLLERYGHIAEERKAERLASGAAEAEDAAAEAMVFDLTHGMAPLKGEPLEVACGSDVRRLLYTQTALMFHRAAEKAIEMATDSGREDVAAGIGARIDDAIIAVVCGLDAETDAEWLVKTGRKGPSARFECVLERYWDFEGFRVRECLGGIDLERAREWVTANGNGRHQDIDQRKAS